MAKFQPFIVSNGVIRIGEPDTERANVRMFKLLAAGEDEVFVYRVDPADHTQHRIAHRTQEQYRAAIKDLEV